MNHDELFHLDAAYVLGALDAEDRKVFEQHLSSCSACAQAVREVEPMPRLLSHVDESVFGPGEEAEPVPETLLPGLLHEVRGRQRRRRRWALAAAAAVVVAGGTAVAWTGWPDDEQVAVAPAGTAMQQVGQDVLRASLAMEEVPWGTRLELTCTYDAPAGGYRDGAPTPAYTLAVRTSDGRWEQVATWRAVPGRTVTVTGATAAGTDDITSVEVRSPSGRPLLELDS